MDWLLHKLADRLGVAPARAGEALSPHLRFEQPWPQAVTLLVLLGAATFIIWIYRREGPARPITRVVLAGLRISLVVLAVIMLSEVVLSVERTGLPYFVVMVDDSASQQVADSYGDAKTRAAVAELAKAVGSPGAAPSPGQEPKRLDVARGLVMRDGGSLLKQLQAQHKVRLYLVSSDARPLSSIDQPEDVAPALEALKKVEANGAQSRLGAGVRRVLTELRGAPPSAVLLLSDGQTTDGEPLEKAAELAARKGVPIFAVGLGDPEAPRDLELGELLVDDVAFVDDLIRFQAKITSRGYAGQDLTLTLAQRIPGQTEPKVLETQRIKAPPDDKPLPVEIGHRPHETGDITYILEIARMERELQADNNRVEKVVQVRKEKLKVLVVDGQPRYEYRYLKHFLERESTIELSVVLLSSDPEYAEQDLAALATFPTSKEALFEYDVIILGDADPSLLTSSQMSNLAEFVIEKGGGLLFIAGEIDNPLAFGPTPLADLLPVDLADARNPTAIGAGVAAYRPTLTAEGRANPIFRFGDDEATSARVWQTLPPLYWYLETPRKKPAATVLAVHPSQKGVDGPLPLILFQYVGAGKTMYHAFDDTWRWRMRVGDQYFGAFWIRTIRFLARSKLLGKLAEVSTDRRRYQRSQPIQVRVRFPNPGLAPSGGEVAVQVERAGQGPRRLTLKAMPGSRNLFEGALPPSTEGDYTVRLLPPPVLQGPIPTAAFRVDPPAGELERVRMNQAELLRAAESTGGRFYTAATVDTLLEDLPKPQKVPLDTDPPIPLWNTWAMLGLFLALLAAEWVLRKRNQMV